MKQTLKPTKTSGFICSVSKLMQIWKLETQQGKVEGSCKAAQGSDASCPPTHEGRERTHQRLWCLLPRLNAAEVLAVYVPTNHCFPNLLTISYESYIVGTLSLRSVRKRNVILSYFNHLHRRRSINSRVSLWNMISRGPRCSAKSHSPSKCRVAHGRVFLPQPCFSSHFSLFFSRQFLSWGHKLMGGLWLGICWVSISHSPWAKVRGSVCLRPACNMH